TEASSKSKAQRVADAAGHSHGTPRKWPLRTRHASGAGRHRHDPLPSPVGEGPFALAFTNLPRNGSKLPAAGGPVLIRTPCHRGHVGGVQGTESS
ncbi:unnamed protein product, partial [Ixodes pacificus]